MRQWGLLVVLGALLLVRCERATSPPPTDAEGDGKTTETRVLEAGSAVLQSFHPIRQIDVYLDGFHAMKDRPEMVMEAHHFCHGRNEDFMQCVIFDGNTADANLIGVEYIIAESLFEGLPADERQLWHPHNYEIMSGELVAPGLPLAAERAFLAKKVNSYGKTWHIWDTGHLGHPGANPLPVGTPLLAWSFNADGEIPEQLVRERDARLKVDTAQRRADRAELVRRAHAQEGVEAIAPAFPNRVPVEFSRPKRPGP